MHTAWLEYTTIISVLVLVCKIQQWECCHDKSLRLFIHTHVVHETWYFYFSDFSQLLYLVAVLLRRIQPPLTALALISFPRVQMSPVVLTGNQQNVSGARHMTIRSGFPYKDNNLLQEIGSLESSRTLTCSISWECSFTDKITMYLILYTSWDLYFWYEWPLLCSWTPTCSIFSNYYL